MSWRECFGSVMGFSVAYQRHVMVPFVVKAIAKANYYFSAS